MTLHSPSAMVRVRLHYHTKFNQHVMNLHYPVGTNEATATSYATAIANQFKILLNSLEGFDSAEYIEPGSNIANSLTFTPIAGTVAGDDSYPDATATCLNFVGRTRLGCRARLFLFVTRYRPDLNWRITPAESSWVGTLTAWLNSSSNALVALDGQAPIWKNYVNLTAHDHWVKQRRRTIA